MLPYMIDSTNYGDMLRDVTQDITRMSSEATEVFAGLRDQLQAILDQVEAWEARRAEFADVAQIDEYNHPETLEDFDFASDAVADDLYDAWDKFAQAEDLFNDDTICISELKMYIENAINQAGVE